MTIEQRRTLDFIGLSKDGNKMILTISDHLEWNDYEYHSMILQDKINDYLEYIYSTHTAENLRDETRRKIEIQLMMKHEPPSKALELFKKIKSELENLGFEFSHDVFAEENADPPN